jgi:hypothetical protein
MYDHATCCTETWGTALAWGSQAMQRTTAVRKGTGAIRSKTETLKEYVRSERELAELWVFIDAVLGGESTNSAALSSNFTGLFQPQQEHLSSSPSHFCHFFQSPFWSNVYRRGISATVFPLVRLRPVFALWPYIYFHISFLSWLID